MSSTVFEDNSLTIGNTPLVQLKRIGNGNIWAKVEARNPAFSVKCRIGANMVWDAEEKGILTEGKSIVEASSGNTGIALCFVAASRGYPITITMPSSMSVERRQVMKALGANIVLTEPAKGMKGAIEKAQEIAQDDNFVLLQQFDNPANPEIHEKTTGPEIWKDTAGEIDVLVAGVGTGGTITGVSRFIKNVQGKAITSVAVEPTSSPVITQTLNGETPTPAPHKIQGIGAGFIPKNLDLDMVDRVEQVTNEDAIAMAKRLMREEGILCGISCGAAVIAAERLSQEAEFADKKIVVILPDSGERYLSTALFEGEFTDNELVQ
ncbi:cysteine synthase A [Marinomonas sp. C2222]|uniref:Cysteine synthase n=1 Tax=Marinomonas sargassi TaxID=2984494 RepID=A0ABT2YS21_9GAMM|nr:cysteine synthase A [Marinomonas sargassi]MCV2402661.1 cysteine synthase A [Marinomonas sargassi]